MLAIGLPTDIESRLDRLAKATGRTRSSYAREAILEHLDDLEDLYLAERRSIDNRAGQSRTCALEEAGPFGHLVTTAHDGTDERAMELMANEVMPARATA